MSDERKPSDATISKEDAAYMRGVTDGKLEALKYTPQERENYGRWIAEVYSLSHPGAWESERKELIEALRRASKLASIAYDWDLGQNGKVEIDGEWISCAALAQEFRAAIQNAGGQSGLTGAV